MRKVLIIGIGAGDPDYVTVQAIDALNRAQVFLVPDKGAGKEDRRRTGHDSCRGFFAIRNLGWVVFGALQRRPDVEGYAETVAEWHGRIADQYEDLLRRELGEGETAGFLVWGDPGLYDSTLRIVETIGARGGLALDYEVIPGITSVQALAARHRIALNRVGGPVHVTTGRRLAAGFPPGLDDAVVMLDGDQAFARLGRDDLDIFWGAYLGTEDEILVAGRLSEVMGDIERLRAEARARKGWIMDTYLRGPPRAMGTRRRAGASAACPRPRLDLRTHTLREDNSINVP